MLEKKIEDLKIENVAALDKEREKRHRMKARKEKEID